jgi:hypothetical protein
MSPILLSSSQFYSAHHCDCRSRCDWSASCSSSRPAAGHSANTSPRVTRPADFATELRRRAENMVTSLQSAAESAEPGSAAAEYFDHLLLGLRAYVGVGGSGAAMRPIPLTGGGVGFCSTRKGKAVCWQFEHPRYAPDDRLSSFDVNYVDVRLQVRNGSSPGLPTQGSCSRQT